MVVEICDGDYPFPEIIQVDHNGTIFTFTPIPVYEPEPEPEPLYYNIQVSVNKDIHAISLNPLPKEYENLIFYKDSPIILSFISENYWAGYFDSSERYELSISMDEDGVTCLLLDNTFLIEICYESFPLPEIISIYRGVLENAEFTFTPIPVYE
jgi:hypothetical protein